MILGVLCLLFSDLGSNRGLGPISAVSIALAMLAALTFLPASLVLLGRAAFWPFRPRYGSEHAGGRGWDRVAAAVGRRPARVLVWQPGRAVRAGGLRAHLRRRRHRAVGVGARRIAVGHRPGGPGAPLRRRRGRPGLRAHAGGELAGRRRGGGRVDGVTAGGAVQRRAGRPARRRRPPSRSWSTAWSASTPPWATPPTARRPRRRSPSCAPRSRDVDPDALVGGSTASDLDTQETVRRATCG